MKKLGIAIAVVLLLPAMAGALFPQEVTSFLVDTERGRSGLAYASRTVDGETWHYLKGGPEAAETIVLLHGFGGDKDNWLRFAARLTDDYRVFVPDLPGFGQNPRDLSLDYGVAAQTGRVHRFIAAVSDTPVHLGGHSMGGHIAGWYAHTHAERLRSLMLVTNGGIRTPVPSDIDRARAAGDDVMLPRSREEYRRLIEWASHEPPFIPWPVRNVLADESIADADFKAELIRRRGDGRDSPLEAVLATFEVPTLVLWGREDRFIDVSAVDVMRTLLPDARYEVLDETGHLPILEKAADSAAIYREFLDAVP